MVQNEQFIVKEQLILKSICRDKYDLKNLTKKY